MSIYDVVTRVSIGGWLSVFVVITLLVQISPLKIDPWTWLGDQLNKNAIKRMDKMEDHVNLIDDKLNDHIAESYRDKILSYMQEVLDGVLKTRDQWSAVIKICAKYEQFIKDNKLINGDATEAIEFLRDTYQECLHSNNFARIEDYKKTK